MRRKIVAGNWKLHGTRAFATALVAEVAATPVPGVELVVPGWRYRVLHAIVKLLPHRVAMGLMARNSRKVRPLD